MGEVLWPSDRRLQQFRKLTEVSRTLTYAVSLDDVLRLAVRRAAELLETGKAVLMLENEDGVLSVRAAFGLDAAVTDEFREPLDETLIRRLQGLLGVAPTRFLGVPLVVGGAVTGILAVALQKDSENPEEDEWLLSALADQTAVALEKSRLDEAAEFRERVIGIVSHDLRSPVQTILFGASALLAREALDDKDTKVVVRIRSSAERAGRMIRDLLDYTQAHLGRGIPVERKPSDLYKIVAQAVDEVESAHPERRIEFTHAGDGRGNFDTDRISQVLSNLLSNAIAYGEPESSITVRGSSDGRLVSVSVHSRGAPIPKEKLPRIFEPMQRAVATSDRTARSVGLGLYIVRHIVEAHGGTVGVESTAGTGTTFTFRIPRE